MSVTDRCTECDALRCTHVGVLFGEFVLRSGETTHEYRAQCILHAKHDGDHEFKRNAPRITRSPA